MTQHLESPLSVKSLGGDGAFVGYASVFNVADSQKEIVATGAFRRTLANRRMQNRMPAMLWMHDPSLPIGVWMKLEEDSSGLRVEGRLALSTQKGREAYELIKMGALTGLSIGYRVISSRRDSVRKARVLTDVELFEISLVTFPANDQARVSAVKSPRTSRAAVSRSSLRTRSDVQTDTEMTRRVVAPLRRAASKLKQKTTRRK